MQSFRLSFSTRLSTEDIRIGKGYNVKRRCRERYMYKKKGNKENSLSLTPRMVYFFHGYGKGKFILRKKKKEKKQKIRSHIKYCYRVRYFK